MAEDRALAAAVLAHHADADALARLRAATLHSSGHARTCCWDAIAALFRQRTGSAAHLKRCATSLASRYRSLVASGHAQLPEAWLTQAAANTARRAAQAAIAAGRPPLQQPVPAAGAAAAPAAAAPSARVEEPAVAAGRKRAREGGAAGAEGAGAGAAPAPGAAFCAWSAAEEAHLLALLARFPAHGEPSTARGGRGTDADTAFWTRIAACLQAASAEGSGRTAYAAYMRATMLLRR